MKKFDPTIFTVNMDMTPTLFEIGNSKNRLLEVENFFKYPEKVREFLDNIPAQDATIRQQPPKTFFPGFQTFINYEMVDLYHFYRESLLEVFEYRLKAGLAFAYQVIDGNKPVFKQSCLPHSDPMFFGSNIFLNYDNEIGEGSGTAFYRSKHTGCEFKPPNDSPYRIRRDFGNKPPDTNHTRFATIKENSDWEMYHLSSQKFNKMNMYEGSLYHAAFMKFNTFTNVPRISLTVGDRVE